MYAEGSSVYTSYRVSNNKSPRSYLKLTVSNLSVYPIQIVEIASEIALDTDSEYHSESIEHFVPPQSSISIEYASNVIYADEKLMLFFYYGAKERGYFYVSSPVYRQRTERAVYRVNTLSQEIDYVDETLSQYENRQLAESYKNLP